MGAARAGGLPRIPLAYGLMEFAISRQTGVVPLRGLGTGFGPVLITLLWRSTIDVCRIVSRAARNEQILAAANEVSGNVD